VRRIRIDRQGTLKLCDSVVDLCGALRAGWKRTRAHHEGGAETDVGLRTPLGISAGHDLDQCDRAAEMCDRAIGRSHLERLS